VGTSQSETIIEGEDSDEREMRMKLEKERKSNETQVYQI
jgi:hypothetical protein